MHQGGLNMPIYEFINTETEEVFEKVVPLGDFDQYLKDNPHIKRWCKVNER